jgi:uncharacterized circularly permuted ATP-grasp superfamily protein
MADVLSDYRPGAAYDEMIDAEGAVRPSYQAIHRSLSRSSPTELRHIADSLANNYTQAGVTFDVGGVERPFPLDLVPRVIAAAEWATIEAGVAQRVRALEAFLADVYAGARVIADGVVPSQLITSSTHFHRAVWGIEPANGVRVHVAGVDLIRNPDGDVRVLEDNVRVPSGVSYVMTNRSAMITALPGAFANQRIRPVAGYPTRLLAALRKCAPSGVDDPTVVVLTPGGLQLRLLRAHAAGPDHGRRAGRGPRPGVPPRQGLHADHRRAAAGGRDLPAGRRRLPRPGALPQRLDARRARLINAVRTGGVTLANAVGNGVADDKLIYTYVPDLIRYYLHAEPILPNVDTWRLEEDVRPRGGAGPADELVVKPVDGSGGKGIVIGPQGEQGGAGRAAPPGHHRPARMDRPAGGPAVDGAHPDRRPAGAAARRPPPVRGEQRRGGVGAARWSDPGRPARG